MTTPAAPAPDVPTPDDGARREANARHATLAVPTAGLGALGELGSWLASVQGVCPPRPPARARVVLFAAEHGIAHAGVSAHDPRVTGFLVEAVRTNTAPVSVVAPAAGASVRLVEVGLGAAEDPAGTSPATSGDHVTAADEATADDATGPHPTTSVTTDADAATTAPSDADRAASAVAGPPAVDAATAPPSGGSTVAGAPAAWVAADRHRVRGISGRIDREDALSVTEVRRAVAVGRAIADEEIDSGADLLIPGAIGVGATTPASTLVAAITGTEPVAVIGRGSGIDDDAWMRKCSAVRDALRRARPHVRDPFALLRIVGGTDIAALTGFLLQAAQRRTPVLLDGVVVVAAAMVADEISGSARAWWLAAQGSPEPALTIAHNHLGLAPAVDTQMRTTDGTGAVALLPWLDMAARLLAETAVLPRAAQVVDVSDVP